MISSNIAPDGKQQMASATSPMHDLLMAALANCSLKFFCMSEIAWSHCSNLTVPFSLSVPEKCGIPSILFRIVVADAPGTAEHPHGYSNHSEHSD